MFIKIITCFIINYKSLVDKPINYSPNQLIHKNFDLSSFNNNYHINESIMDKNLTSGNNNFIKKYICSHNNKN